MATKGELIRLQTQIDDLKEELAVKDSMIMSQAQEFESLQPGSTDAQHNPASIRNHQDTREIEVTEEHERVLRSTGPAEVALDTRGLDVIDKMPSQEKLAELAFMEELVTIKVHDSTDENQVPCPPVWNDGKVQYFIRGENQTVKRKYVERLARAKLTKFSQRKEHDALGNEIYVTIPHTALIFPFEMVEDANPRGRDWLTGIVRDPH